MRRMAFLATAVMAASMMSVTARAQGLSGDDINVNDYVDVGSESFSEGSMTTTDPGAGTVSSFSYVLSPDTISVNVPAGSFANLPFNGVTFTDQTRDPGITDVSLASNTGSEAPQLSFTSNSVSLNFAGYSNFSGNETLTYDLSFPAPAAPVSAAPEPGAWLLMFAGVAMIGSALRFNRRQGLAIA